MIIVAKNRLKQSYDVVSATSGRKIPRVMSADCKGFVLPVDSESEKHYSVTFKLQHFDTFVGQKNDVGTL